MSEIIDTEINLEDYMLVFDLTLGKEVETFSKAYISRWGYNDGTEYGIGLAAFGTLNIIHNKTALDEIPSFFWDFKRENGGFGRVRKLTFNVRSRKKDLEFNFLGSFRTLITVDGETYAINKTSASYIYDEFFGQKIKTFNAGGVVELGEVLKQTGQTKRFYFNWS
ncbi:hypothetical protein QPK13_13190 [Photorhabdus tasmaniensis]